MNSNPSKYHESFHTIKNMFKNKQLKYVYLNIRSLRKNFDNLLVTINPIIKTIDLIILVETNITNEENSLYQIEGFVSEFKNREKRRGGGIALYINKNTNYEIKHPTTTTFETLLLNINTNNTTIPIVAVYRPPGLSNVTLFIEEIRQLFIESKLKKNLLVIGDMNIDTNKNNNHSQEYLDFISTIGLKSCNTLATRICLKLGSRTNIDHILLRETSDIKTSDVGVVKTLISDHYALAVALNLNKQQKIIKHENKITRLDNNILSHLINKTKWDNINTLNANDMYDSITTIMQNIYERSAYISHQTRNRRLYPWITTNIIKDCKIRDKLYKRWYNDRTSAVKEDTYKKFRNLVTKRIKIAKNNYYKQKFDAYNGDPRMTWKIINEILKRKDRDSDPINKYFNKKSGSEIVNDFAESFNSEIKNILHSCNKQLLTINEKKVSQSIFFKLTTTEEIYDILNKLDISKGPGIDKIRPIDLKKHAYIFSDLIKQLINKSIQEAKMPDKMKIAVIRPIYKAGDKSDMTNYRPISILPAIEKIMEEVVKIRIMDFLQKYKILNDKQYGFQTGKSINKLLGDFADELYKAKSNKNHTTILFIDFKKAFDTLDHRKILNKLYNSGIRGMCLDWLKNYLHKRQSLIKVDDILSNPIDVSSGVPQGSKLGPLLYIIYTNDIFEHLQNVKAFAYADDIALISTNIDFQAAKKVLQDNFDNITKWAHDNGLLINAKKTKTMHIPPHHTNTKSINITYKSGQCTNNLSSEIIDTTNEFKYLGIYIDSGLNWKKHIDELRKKIRKASYALYSLKPNCTQTILKQTYHALAESYIRFGISAWGRSTYCKKLQKTLNNTLKLFSLNDRMNILTVETIYKITMINTYYEARRYLVKINHEQSTRQKSNSKYKVPRTLNICGQNTLEYIIPTIFNELTTDLTNIKNKDERKHKIKKFFSNRNRNQL